MGRYPIEDVETQEDDQTADSKNRRFASRETEQPKRSPIRRKNKWRQEDGTKTKAKRSHKKIQRRIKYDWQEE
ncbi:hypothetical protein D1AOALGA4SA_11632 [Olavius algarvensis Delta 1 endosymbiont]|nr:hypothetical protein D1AOALGA4SA_11632 [Olavius algarvensis Delta 1 endosymbiont]